MKTKTVMHLSLCRKAGKLKGGFDAVVEGLKEGRIFAAALAVDLSDKTKKNIIFIAGHLPNPVPVVLLDDRMDDIALIAGKRVGVLGVTDRSLAKKLCELGQHQAQMREENTLC